MAIRVEELAGPRPARETDARIYRFPVRPGDRPDERPRVAPRPSRAELRRAALRRRRAIARRRMLAALTVVVVSVVMLFAGGPSAVAPAGDHRTPRVVVVQPGQTLWALAERYAGDGIDPRAYVDAVLALNHLEGPPPAGARIKLPR